MCNCSCGSEEKKNALLPQVGIITDIRRETPDVKTFRIVRPDGTKLFEHMPGQCAMLCVPGVGEALFSITSSPTNKEYQEFSIKECGTLTNYLHNMSVGDEILVRGPYGNHFPVETVLKGQDLLFIAGGIGLAPLRSVINYVLDNRDNYGKVDIVYGSRSKDDLVQLKEIQEVWAKAKDVNVHLTIDREQEGWDGHVGFVPNYVKELNMSVDKTALICGPPIMIKFVLQGLQELGYEKTQVYTTLELFIAGGIGLAPLRSVINYVLDNRDNYGTVDIVYGSRSKDDLVQLKEIQEVWAKAKDVNVHLTIDREQEGWDGHVGFVPNYVKELNMSVDKTALICGPPIMIKFVLQGLQELGYEKTQVYTTLELRMKCGIGKCGRCNIGDKYVCKDGPVFRCDEIDELPNEY